MAKETDSDIFKYVEKANELDPALVGVNTNLSVSPQTSSPTRLYMVSGNIPKAVVTEGGSERKILTGFEYQYAKTARRIEAPSNMVVEEVFYVKSQSGGADQTDKWNSIWIVFKNDEKNMYDVLELPRYNTQNTYVGFEYVYDKNLLRKLTKGATFAKGTVFAKSPRISDSGEWCFGMDLKVALGSFLATEEDGIVVTESCARDKLRCMFEHERKFSWNEDDYIPLMLYGTPENPKPFPESGEGLRPDGIVMGFRRRISEHALVSLTKKALRVPDEVHDVLFRAPTESQVMSVEVLSEKMKNRSNNRSTDYIPQQHTELLERYERRQNDMWNGVMSWYNNRVSQNRGEPIPTTEALDYFIRLAFGNYTKNNHTGKVNNLFRAVKRVRLRDWNVNIKLKESVNGRTKYKMSGMYGDKGVIVDVIPDEDAPRYDDGTTAEIYVNNTPAFRRQIYSMLMEQSINFINMNIHKEVKTFRAEGNYKAAYDRLMLFYETGFPEFAEIVKSVNISEDNKMEHVDDVCRTQIAVQFRSDSELYGVEVIKELNKVFKYKPQHITFTNSLGERVRSKNPVLITHQHFLLLDKFGTDMSAQALPQANLFGMPAKLNDSTRHAGFLRNVHNRNSGETETRLRISQSGPKEVMKNLAMAYSPELRKRMTKRIIRAHDPFDIDQLVREDEYHLNKAVQMASSMLSDSGYTLRKEQATDKYIPTGEFEEWWKLTYGSLVPFPRKRYCVGEVLEWRSRSRMTLARQPSPTPTL